MARSNENTFDAVAANNRGRSGHTHTQNTTVLGNLTLDDIAESETKDPITEMSKEIHHINRVGKSGKASRTLHILLRSSNISLLTSSTVQFPTSMLTTSATLPPALPAVYYNNK